MRRSFRFYFVIHITIRHIYTRFPTFFPETSSAVPRSSALCRTSTSNPLLFVFIVRGGRWPRLLHQPFVFFSFFSPPLPFPQRNFYLRIKTFLTRLTSSSLGTLSSAFGHENKFSPPRWRRHIFPLSHHQSPRPGLSLHFRQKKSKAPLCLSVSFPRSPCVVTRLASHPRLASFDRGVSSSGTHVARPRRWDTRGTPCVGHLVTRKEKKNKKKRER